MFHVEHTIRVSFGIAPRRESESGGVLYMGLVPRGTSRAPS